MYPATISTSGGGIFFRKLPSNAAILPLAVVGRTMRQSVRGLYNDVAEILPFAEFGINAG